MSTSCASNNTTSPVEPEKTSSSFKMTGIQKIMADRALKPVTQNNPIVAYKFSADPAVLVYKDTVYVYATNDAQQAETTLGMDDNHYDKINSLNVFCSKDLVNWTDCGEIKVAGKVNKEGAAKWATNSWAPAIATKNINGTDKFFLYFADSANGIGVLTSDSPTGPFVDPRGSALISRQTPNTKGVHWLFDPAVLVDDDGKGYLYYGGGVADDIPHPRSARCVKLTDDMIEIADLPKEIDPPFLFEDSGINKINGKYVYSYCTNWADRKDFPGADPIAVIGYMTSDNPLGPFEYKGYTLKNPGTYFGAWGNNHHWMFQFKDKWYIAYHTQTMEKQVGLLKGGYRNIFINEIEVNEDGTLPIQNVSKEGVAQVGTFNPYETIPASTMNGSVHVAIANNPADAKNPIAFASDKNAYLYIKGVDFTAGASKVMINLAEGSTNGTVTFRLDHFAKGDVIAEVNVKGTKAEAAVTLPAGTSVKDLYVSIDGNIALVDYVFVK